MARTQPTGPYTRYNPNTKGLRRNLRALNDSLRPSKPRTDMAPAAFVAWALGLSAATWYALWALGEQFRVWLA